MLSEAIRRLKLKDVGEEKDGKFGHFLYALELIRRFTR